MHSFHSKLAGLACIALAVFAPVALGAAPASATTEIEVWHSLSGVAQQTFEELTNQFNSEQNQVHVTLVYKGDARTAVEAGLAALKAHNGPDLIELKDSLGARFAASSGGLRPISEVLALDKTPDFNFTLPGSASFLRDSKGKLLAFPLVVSMPVLLYNRDAFIKAGLEPDVRARTWKDLQQLLVAVQDEGRGTSCAYTTSYQNWIHIENVAAWDGASFASRDNGMEGPGASLSFNDLLHVRHIALLESWVKAELFKFSGHGTEGDARFAAGECTTLTTASADVGDILAKANFKVGAAPLPIYEEVTPQPVASLVQGSGLWAVQGKKPPQYLAMARFLAYLAKPVPAAEWSERTGSMPINTSAMLALEHSNLTDRVKGLVQVMGLETGRPLAGARGVRLANLDEIEADNDSELEQVWNGHKAAKEALDDAVREGNVLLKRPEAALH